MSGQRQLQPEPLSRGHDLDCTLIRAFRLVYNLIDLIEPFVSARRV